MSVRPHVAAWLAVLTLPAAAAAQGPVRLREAFPAGTQYHVSIREESAGELRLPPEGDKPAPPPVRVQGRGAYEYDERVLDPGSPANPAPKTLRVFRRFELDRTVDDQPQEATLRPAVRRLVLLRRGHREVSFSPDGPLTWDEVHLVSKDVFTPALAAALTPDRPVAPGDRWPAGRAAVEELTDLEQVEGSLECRFEEVTAVNGRRLARVRFGGAVKGLNEDGPNRQQLNGLFYFDLESNHLSYLSLEGTHLLLDKDGREAGRVKGQFVLTRQAHAHSPELRDEALRGLTLEPNADNTLLLYVNLELGVQFFYPRRWRVSLVKGRQVTLDEAAGGGVLLTVEPLTGVPTGAAYLAESRAYLEKQQARVLAADPPQRVQGPPAELERFGLDVELNGQRERLEYFVARQAGGGATVAARLRPKELAALQRDVERIARSLRVAVPVAPAAPNRPVPVPPPPKNS
jgi:hypothetical protein